MKLILLGGNSLKNKEWIYRVSSVLEPLFEEIKVQDYKHWESGEEIINLEGELRVLEETTKNFEEYIVFAKSAGVVLTLKGVHEKKINPKKCVFVGTPILWSRENIFEIDLWLEDYSIPTLFIQQAGDPAYAYKDLAELLKDKRVKNYKIIKLEGTSHDYEDLEVLKKEMSKFIDL